MSEHRSVDTIRRGMLIRDTARDAHYHGVCRVIVVDQETIEVLPVNAEAFHMHLKNAELVQAGWEEIEPSELVERFRTRSNTVLCSRCISEAVRYERKDADRAVLLLSEALSYKPNSLDALQGRANLYYATKRFSEAEPDYSALPTEDAEIWTEQEAAVLLLVKRATCRKELGNLEGAAEDLSKTLSLGPERIDTHQSLAAIYLELSEAHVRRARELAAEWEEQTKPQSDRDQLGLF